MNRRALLRGGLVLGFGTWGHAAWTPVAAQAQQRKGVFGQLIREPTGENGYEELALACDALAESRLYAEVERLELEGQPVPLAVKRRVLAEPPVVRALELVRAGVAKPVASPRTSLSSQTVLPELAPFRRIARLMNMRHYVLFADGNGAAAIDSLRTGLHFAYVVQTDTLISGLVGIAMTAIFTKSFGAHLRRLGAADCDRLFAVCVERLRLPDLLTRMVRMERRNSRIFLDELRTADRRQLQQMFGQRAHGAQPVDATPEELAAWERERQFLDEFDRVRAAGGVPGLLRQVQRRLDDHYDGVLAEAEKPPWQRSLPPPPEEESLSGWLFGLVAPRMDRIGYRYTAERTMVQLLALHARILRYRWEFDRLPGDLERLHVGELARDPYTGRPVEYEVRGRRYRLASAGEPVAGDSPRAVNGRLPLTVTPEGE